MILEKRISLLVALGNYLRTNDPKWLDIKERAQRENGWFVQEFIDLASQNIANEFLDEQKLQSWAKKYGIGDADTTSRQVGIVMAGNIPLVGFHDFLCSFISGHRSLIKLSSKDNLLLKHLVEFMAGIDGEVNDLVTFSERLNGADAYIATGSNNSSRYFEYYFKNYRSIIRKNRTSAAVLTGNESPEDLRLLGNDLLYYFGLGCRNVSKLYVPEGYDFVPLLNALEPYKWMDDHNKFRNNYDYNLALHMLNGQYYMTNGTVLLVENESLFSPISQINFSFYQPGNAPSPEEKFPDELQCVVAHHATPFGESQKPGLTDYADGIDTLDFLTRL